MGLLSDFLVAELDDALRYPQLVQGGHPISPKLFEIAEYGDFTPIELDILWAILRNEQRKETEHRLEHIFSGEDNESWLLRFPEDFVFRLAELNEKTAYETAHLWATSLEMFVTPEELSPILHDLIRLATLAKTNGKDLFLYGSL